METVREEYRHFNSRNKEKNCSVNFQNEKKVASGEQLKFEMRM